MIQANDLLNEQERAKKIEKKFSLPPDQLTVGWVDSFLERHGDVIHKGWFEYMEKARAEVKVQDIQDFFSKLKNCIESNRVSSRLIANFDETMLKVDQRFHRAVIPRRTKYGIRAGKNRDNRHISLGVTIFSKENFSNPAPLLVILPQSEWPNSVGSALAGEFSWAGSKSGWMTKEIFESWVEKIFLPTIERRRVSFNKVGRAGLLVLDGHTSRIAPRAMEMLAAANVHVVTFVGHSSHICQPLDLSVFPGFQSKMRLGASQFRIYDYEMGMSKVLYDALSKMQSVLTSENIFKGFSYAGIDPLDEDMVLPKLRGEVVEKRLEPAIATGRKGRTGVSISNQVLTSREGLRLVKELAKKLEEKEAKRKAKEMLEGPDPPKKKRKQNKK